VYRLYEGAVGQGTPQAITAASKEDGHPAVSPDGRWLVYVSARSGIGKLFLRDLTTGAERPLTTGNTVDLYPVWSPDSRAIAYTSGDNDNHDVSIVSVTEPSAAPRQLTAWKFDDLRPTFSPDGSLIAFYSNYSPSGEDKEWSIVVVPASGSGPSKGAALAALTVAENVVKDPEVGPAWLSWGKAIVYARNLKAEWNPIYVVDVDSREQRRLETGTRMNHDLACSRRGALAFRAQVASWDDIFVAQLPRTP
jgi:Tol biopolymer transport system component